MSTQTHSVVIQGVAAPDDGLAVAVPNPDSGVCPDCGGKWIWEENEHLLRQGHRVCAIGTAGRYGCGSRFSVSTSPDGVITLTRLRHYDPGLGRKAVAQLEASHAAASLGRLGGQATSKAKAKAARANGAKGGRPPKK